MPTVFENVRLWRAHVGNADAFECLSRVLPCSNLGDLSSPSSWFQVRHMAPFAHPYILAALHWLGGQYLLQRGDGPVSPAFCFPSSAVALALSVILDEALELEGGGGHAYARMGQSACCARVVRGNPAHEGGARCQFG